MNLNTQYSQENVRQLIYWTDLGDCLPEDAGSRMPL